MNYQTYEVLDENSDRVSRHWTRYCRHTYFIMVQLQSYIAADIVPIPVQDGFRLLGARLETGNKSMR